MRRLLLNALPKQAIQNDANDYNILVEGELGRTAISGLIDFGDMCAAPKVCELAIAGAYVVLDHPRPERALAALVRGYHAANRLSVEEVELRRFVATRLAHFKVPTMIEFVDEIPKGATGKVQRIGLAERLGLT